MRQHVAFAISIFLVTPAFPWGDEGHRLVARIAARHISGQTQRGIVKLVRGAQVDDLNLGPTIARAVDDQSLADAVEDVLAAIATWPDHMPHGKGATAPWHFIDIGLFEGVSHMSERCEQGCVNQKIREIRDNLRRGDALGGFPPDKELRFLVHFLGDIHQPLHAVTNADAGGNCERVTGFSGFTKLHGVWDTALVREIINENDDVEATLIAEFSNTRAAAQAVTDPDKMAAESFDLAGTAVYGRARPRVPVIRRFVDLRPQECATKAPASINRVRINGADSFDNEETLRVIRQQLYKGGVRLAAILDSIFQ